MFILLWIGLCFVVALTGNNKKIGYWGVFLLSLILSPLIGLIIGVLSGEKIKKPSTKSWECEHCGFKVFNMAEVCSNCKIKMSYPNEAYNDIRYTCADCKKQFYGRREACPHCDLVCDW